MSSEDRSFSHLDSHGNARMVDVSGKEATRREAEASCLVEMSPSTLARLTDLPKGDALAVARLAGIQGAKHTAELIPLAHPLPIDRIDVKFREVENGLEIRSSVVVRAPTGAELEALVACSTAALALYDMVKSVERAAVIRRLRLERKSGGRSGTFERSR